MLASSVNFNQHLRNMEGCFEVKKVRTMAVPGAELGPPELGGHGQSSLPVVHSGLSATSPFMLAAMPLIQSFITI